MASQFHVRFFRSVYITSDAKRAPVHILPRACAIVRQNNVLLTIVCFFLVAVLSMCTCVPEAKASGQINRVSIHSRQFLLLAQMQDCIYSLWRDSTGL